MKDYGGEIWIKYYRQKIIIFFKDIVSIPKKLQATGCEFEMFCVTEKGVPVILKDQDKDPATITITTDKF